MAVLYPFLLTPSHLNTVIRNGFEIGNKVNKVSVTLTCSSLDEKKSWVKTVRGLIKDYQKMVLFTLSSCSLHEPTASHCSCTYPVG